MRKGCRHLNYGQEGYDTPTVCPAVHQQTVPEISPRSNHGNEIDNQSNETEEEEGFFFFWYHVKPMSKISAALERATSIRTRVGTLAGGA